MIVVVVVLLACAAQTGDPSDVPLPLEALPAPTVAVSKPALRPTAVVVELVALGVDDATGREVTRLVVENLQRTLASHEVRGPEALDAATRARAAACDSAACFADVAASAGERGGHVDVIVHGTVQKLGAGQLVTLDVGAHHAVAHSKEAGQLSVVVDAACASLAQQMAAAPSTTASPTTNAPTTNAPTTAPLTPPTKTPTTPGGPPNDDFVLLAVDYALLFLPVPGSGLFLPLVQGAVHGFAGDQITNNAYPNWWMGTLAGYAVLGVGGLAAGGLYVYGLTTLNPIALFGALGVLGLAYVVEPGVVWFFARTGATSVGEAVHPSDSDLLRGSPLAGIPITGPITAVPDDVAAAHFR